MIDLLVVGVGLWIIGIVSIGLCDNEARGRDVVFWPITLMCLMFQTLFRREW